MQSILNKILIDNKLVIASHNDGKITELKELFKDYNLKLLSSKQLELEEPKENGHTFEQNALIKSSNSSKKTGLLAISDDSGICFDALDGRPGIYSARLAGKSKNFNTALNKINSLMKDKKVTKCKFVCALSISWPDGKHITERGEIFGNYTWPPRGKLGFGYDPIFIPSNYNQTFGELYPKLKHSISHRYSAFQKLKNSLFKLVNEKES